MTIKFELSEDDYNLLIQMLVNSNPIIQKIAQQAQAQMKQAQEQAKPPPETKTPEIVKPTPFEQRERTR